MLTLTILRSELRFLRFLDSFFFFFKNNETKKKIKETSVFSVQEKIFYFLSSDLNRTYCSFLLHTVSDFEETNIQLQSASPKIQVLKQILEELLKGLFVKFVKPSVIKMFKDLTEVPYQQLENQKDDEELVIGNKAFDLLKTLSASDKDIFFCSSSAVF